MSGFEGFPEAALDFYDDLEIDNSKTFWVANKHIYTESVATPMKALAAALEPEFGSAKIFRPYRDVRFAKDKTPYKTSQGMFIAQGPSTGWYFHIGAAGIMVGAGFYEATSARLASLRAAIDNDKTGKQLQKMTNDLVSDGWRLGGDRVKTAPRGYDVDHPRIELLRHKSMSVGRNYGFEPFIHTAELLDHIRTDWKAVQPFLDWMLKHGTA